LADHPANPVGDFLDDGFRYIAANLHRALLPNHLRTIRRAGHLPADDVWLPHPAACRHAGAAHHANSHAAAGAADQTRHDRSRQADFLSCPATLVFRHRAVSRHRTHHGVTAFLHHGFGHGPHHGATAFPFTSCPDRTHHRAAAFPFASFPNRATGRVV